MTDGNGGQMIGIVSNIQKFTVHDGPGIRTEVFFKGCPLKCKWCSNPESIKPGPEVGVFAQQCIGVDKCGLCLKACPHADENVLVVENGKVARIDRTKCRNCVACANACPTDALKIFGKKVTVSEVVKTILEDRSFYENSNGGVTLSGGDPLLQWEFVLQLLKECKRRGVHTCVETELHCNTEILDEIFPYTNLLMTDIKHMDSRKHKEFTGVGNEKILANIKYAVKKGMPLVIRIPVVPGHNDDDENIKATADFIVKDLGNSIRQLQLLPYRLLGLEKYEALGIAYPMAGVEPPKSEIYLSNVRRLAEVMKSFGVPAVPGTTIKFN